MRKISNNCLLDGNAISPAIEEQIKEKFKCVMNLDF